MPLALVSILGRPKVFLRNPAPLPEPGRMSYQRPMWTPIGEARLRNSTFLHGQSARKKVTYEVPPAVRSGETGETPPTQRLPANYVNPAPPHPPPRGSSPADSVAAGAALAAPARARWGSQGAKTDAGQRCCVSPYGLSGHSEFQVKRAF